MAQKETLKSPFLFFYRIIGKRGREIYINFLSRKIKSDRFNLPSVFESINSILIILPEDLRSALLQVETITSIMSAYPEAAINILTPNTNAKWFKKFHGIDSFLTYDCDEICFASHSTTKLKRALKELSIDLCFILDKNPPQIISYLLTRIKSLLRISYKDALNFPFANIRVAKTDTSNNIIDTNLLILRTLNIKTTKGIKWSVTRDRVEEMKHLLNENGIIPREQFGLIDADYIINRFGKTWAESFINNTLSNNKNIKWLIYIEKKPDTDKLFSWFAKFNIPVFFKFSPSQIAALLSKTSIIVSGKSYLFELAHLLHKNVLGLFCENEINNFCSNKKFSNGILLPNKPDETIFVDISKEISRIIC